MMNRQTMRSPSRGEPERLVETEQEVRVLHGLPRRALHEVVDGGDDDERGMAHVGRGHSRDAYHVAMDYVAQRRYVGRHFNEGLTAVLLAPWREDIGEWCGKRHGDRREDAARDRKQVRREDQ